MSHHPGPRADAIFQPGYLPATTRSDTKKEDSLLSQLGRENSAKLPPRPSYGSKGTAVTLWTNYFAMAVKSQNVLHRYKLTVSPVKEATEASGKGKGKEKAAANDSTGQKPEKKLAKKVIKRVIEIFISDVLKPHNYTCATDFSSTLILLQELEQRDRKYIIRYRAEIEAVAAENAKTYALHVQHTGTLSMSNVVDFATSGRFSSLFGDTQDIIQALNIITGYHPKTSQGIATVGTNRHVNLNCDKNDFLDLGAGLAAMRAFAFSVRRATERLLINVQITNLAFYKTGRLDHLIQDPVHKNGPNVIPQIPDIARFVRMLSVEVSYLRRTNKSGQQIPSYRTIVGLAQKGDGKAEEVIAHRPKVKDFGAGPNDVEFWLSEESTSASKSGDSKDTVKGGGPSKTPYQGGKFITVSKHFKDRHGVTIEDSNLPVVNIGSSDKPVYVPMQVCYVREGQLAKERITGPQSQSMIQFAVRPPAQNAKSIVNTGLTTIGIQQANSTLNSFGIEVDKRMISVPGRQLGPPTLVYRNGATLTPNRGQWNITKHKLAQGVQIGKDEWTWLNIKLGANDTPPIIPDGAIKTFADALRQSGIQIGAPKDGSTISVVPRNASQEIYKAIAPFEEKPPKLLLVIVPHKNRQPRASARIYSQVKYLCDVKFGIINVCISDAKYAENKKQIMANVGLKINLKLGGQNHTIQRGGFGGIPPSETMFVGLDVTHPSPGSHSEAPSVAAIVSSTDGSLTHWPATLRIQREARQEMVDALYDLFRDCLRRFKKKSNCLPKYIIMYRDGVSEGQYQQVLEKELPALRAAIDMDYPPVDKKKGHPKIAIIIVGKRHHTRFYPTSKEEADYKFDHAKNEKKPGTGNPQCGTVVDRGVTEVANWDFFLQSHTALHGTAKPSHYYVVYDEIFSKDSKFKDNPANALEKLSYDLCYAFGRATTAVSVCPPAYYADLACERARSYLASYYNPNPADERPGAPVQVGNEPMTPELMIRVDEKVAESMFYI